MEKLKNLCGQIPEELHNKVRTEQESLGLTLGKYLEQVLTAHFAAPAPAVRGGDRTLAFQVPEVLFQRVKQYLEAHKPLSQKAFVVGLLENALSADAGPVLPVLLQIHLWFLSLALLQTLCQIRDGVFDLCS